MRDLVDVAQLDHLVGQETERPAAPARGGLPHAKAIRWASCSPSSIRGRRGPADEGRLEAAFDEVAADPVDGDRSDIQGETDLFVGPGRPRVAAIGFQEDAGSGQLARRRLTLGDEGLQSLALLGREADDVSLVHDRTPS